VKKDARSEAALRGRTLYACRTSPLSVTHTRHALPAASGAYTLVVELSNACPTNRNSLPMDSTTLTYTPQP